MGAGSLLVAVGAAPRFFLGVLSFLYVVLSAYVYISLIHQIRTRTSNRFEEHGTGRTFVVAEAILAAVLIFFLLLNIGVSICRAVIVCCGRNLLYNFLLIVFVVVFIVRCL